MAGVRGSADQLTSCRPNEQSCTQLLLLAYQRRPFYLNTMYLELNYLQRVKATQLSPRSTHYYCNLVTGLGKRKPNVTELIVLETYSCAVNRHQSREEKSLPLPGVRERLSAKPIVLVDSVAPALQLHFLIWT